MTSADCCRSPRAFSLMPTSSFALFTCSATPQHICPSPTPSSSNNSGAPLNPAGTSNSPTLSSKNCATASANPIQPGLPNYAKKREHYLAFLKYPEYMRKSFSTTNVVEAINGQLEIMRRNSGGYFHSEDSLKFKLGLAISSLENGMWRTPNHRIHSVLDQLNAMFQARFDGSK